MAGKKNNFQPLRESDGSRIFWVFLISFDWDSLLRQNEYTEPAGKNSQMVGKKKKNSSHYDQSGTMRLRISDGVFNWFCIGIVISNKVKHTGDVSSLQVSISSLQEASFHWNLAILGLDVLGLS